MLRLCLVSEKSWKFEKKKLEVYVCRKVLDVMENWKLGLVGGELNTAFETTELVFPLLYKFMT